MSNISGIEQLFNTMLQLGKLMSQRTKESHEERAATMLQFSALHFVKEQPNGTVSEIATSMQLSKSSATQLIERLVQAGLVKRIPDTEDRRITRLIITSQGEKEFGILREKKLTKMKEFTAKIPAKDLRELIRINTNLIEALRKEQK